MALYNKSDMVYNDYKWTAYPGDDPRVTGKPDSTRFNRHEGYEVLYLINKLAEMWLFKSTADCKKLERMIHDHLPSDIIMQEDVEKWLSANWYNY